MRYNAVQRGTTVPVTPHQDDLARGMQGGRTSMRGTRVQHDFVRAHKLDIAAALCHTNEGNLALHKWSVVAKLDDGRRKDGAVSKGV